MKQPDFKTSTYILTPPQPFATSAPYYTLNRMAPALLFVSDVIAILLMWSDFVLRKWTQK